MDINNYEILLSIVGTVFSLLLTSIVCWIKAIKSGKQKKLLQNHATFMDAIAPLMELAEKYHNYSGEEKKQFVLTKMNQLAIENNLKFDAEEISNRIEELITLSKEVNNKK